MAAPGETLAREGEVRRLCETRGRVDKGIGNGEETIDIKSGRDGDGSPSIAQTYYKSMPAQETDGSR